MPRRLRQRPQPRAQHAVWPATGISARASASIGQSIPHPGSRPDHAARDPALSRRWTPAGERGHPIQHAMVKDMPTSTCIVLPHPSRHQCAQLLPRASPGGTTKPTERSMYPRRQQHPDSDDRATRPTCTTPRAAAARGLWSNLYPNELDHTGARRRPGLPGEPGRPGVQPAAHAHPVRRFPWPRLGVPRRLQAGPPRPYAGLRR